MIYSQTSYILEFLPRLTLIRFTTLSAAQSPSSQPGRHSLHFAKYNSSLDFLWVQLKHLANLI